MLTQNCEWISSSRILNSDWTGKLSLRPSSRPRLSSCMRRLSSMISMFPIKRNISPYLMRWKFVEGMWHEVSEQLRKQTQNCQLSTSHHFSGSRRLVAVGSKLSVFVFDSERMNEKSKERNVPGREFLRPRYRRCCYSLTRKRVVLRCGVRLRQRRNCRWRCEFPFPLSFQFLCSDWTSSNRHDWSREASRRWILHLVNKGEFNFYVCTHAHVCATVHSASFFTPSYSVE